MRSGYARLCDLFGLQVDHSKTNTRPTPFQTHGGFSLKSLASKRTDWVRIAFILHNLGQLPPAQISNVFCKAWPTRSRSSREIAQIIKCYRSKGFELVGQFNRGHEHFKIYGFYGEMPMIPKSTRKRWEKELNPFRGWSGE